MMRASRALLPLVAALALALSACSDSGDDAATPASSPSAGSGTVTGTTTQVCGPVAGEQLVALADDRKLQNSDNVLPVVRTAVLTDPLRQALDEVSNALTQEALNSLNKATDIDRQQPAEAAAAFVRQQDLGSGITGGSGPIRVVAANFAENQTLANVFAETLKRVGFDATVVQLTNREVYAAALKAGEVDLVAEYAATLTEFLNPDKANPVASSDIQQTVAALTPLATAAGLTPLTPADATDQNAFAVTKAFSDRYGVASLSDLARVCGGGVTLGGPPECPQRPFCQAGLESTYQLKVSGFTSLDAGGPLSKNALKTGKVAVALVLSSDASLSS